jgi:hypothetical protein
MGDRTMRCLACNCNLSDFESTRKNAFTGEYTDLCNQCFSSISRDMHTIERSDLGQDEGKVEESYDLGLDNEH